MANAKVMEVPGLLLAVDDGWAVNIGLVAWRLGPISLTKARRQLRAEGRKVKRIGRRDFVRLRASEVETYYRVAAYWGRLFATEFRRASRRG